MPNQQPRSLASGVPYINTSLTGPLTTLRILTKYTGHSNRHPATRKSTERRAKGDSFTLGHSVFLIYEPGSSVLAEEVADSVRALITIRTGRKTK